MHKCQSDLYKQTKPAERAKRDIYKQKRPNEQAKETSYTSKQRPLDKRRRLHEKKRPTRTRASPSCKQARKYTHTRTHAHTHT